MRQRSVIIAVVTLLVLQADMLMSESTKGRSQSPSQFELLSTYRRQEHFLRDAALGADQHDAVLERSEEIGFATSKEVREHRLR